MGGCAGQLEGEAPPDVTNRRLIEPMNKGIRKMKHHTKNPLALLAAGVMALGLAGGTGWAAEAPADMPAKPMAKKMAKPKAKKVAMARKASKKGSPRIMAMQKALKKAGYDPGPVDGKIGKKTRVALAAFQKANGIKPTGRYGKQTSAKLKAFMN